MSAITRRAQHHPPCSTEQWHNLRYEDLLISSFDTIHELCDFLEIGFEECMLDHDEDSNQKLYANWEAKWKSKSNLDLDQSRIGAYKHEMSEDDQITLNWFLQKELKNLDYPVDLSNVSYKHLNFTMKGYLDLASQKLLNFLSDLY